MRDKKPLSQITTDGLREALRADVLTAAPLLLGCFLIRGELRSRIVEVEAYRDNDDPGCHAFYGRTPRTEIMFGEPGFAYVYFTYGNHWMLNITAHEPGRGAAVLIRAAEPISGVELMGVRRGVFEEKQFLSGPGKLCKAYGIERAEYGIDLLSPNSELRIETGARVENVVSGTRIGLTPGKGDLLLWRFADGDAIKWVSAKKTNLATIG